MAITSQSDRRKSNRRESNRRKGDTKIIKIEEEGGKQGMTVRRETGGPKKAESAWSWQEEFAVGWSETFLTKGKTSKKRRIV